MIFIRFYIPQIFPDLKRYIYLDNDIIVTADLTELYSRKLYKTYNLPDRKQQTTVQKVSQRDANPLKSPRAPLSIATNTINTVTIGFVYEKHPFYTGYIKTHFNTSSVLVKNVIGTHGSDIFLNGGVFVVDAVMWRRKQLTAKIEHFIAQNGNGTIYNGIGVGDQGPFYLLFANDSAYLEAQYNMRRLPKKTVHLLEEGFTGKKLWCAIIANIIIILFYTQIITLNLFIYASNHKKVLFTLLGLHKAMPNIFVENH